MCVLGGFCGFELFRELMSYSFSCVSFLLAGCEGVEPPKLGFGIPAASSAHPRSGLAAVQAAS